jgi:TRAP-type mannitol/chloroaromatic compound transport system substrate-binding protein
MTTSWNEALDVLQGAGQLIAERVSAMTGGRFTIEVFTGGEIAPALEVLDAVQDGRAECGHTASFYFIDKNEAFGIATGLPFGLTPQQQNAWLYAGGGMEAVQKIYADFGIVSFPAGGTGTQMGGWLRREVSTLDDLKGFRFRIPGLGGRVMEQLGVETVIVPGSDIFDSLSTGDIDGAEWIGPHDDEKLGLNDAASFYYYPGWWEPGSTLDVLVNRQAWESLPTEYQEIFKTAAYQANISVLSRYEVQNQEALVRMVAGGTQLRPYSQEIMKAAKDAAFELYEEIARKNPSFQEIFEPWQEFRKRIYQWNRFNELSFAWFATEHL